MTGIPSVYLCVSAKVNSEQLFHSENVLHEKQVCGWSEGLRSPELEEWHWTIFKTQLNLCWTTASAHFCKGFFLLVPLHTWMQVDFTRSELKPEHTRAILEGHLVTPGQLYQLGQEMINVTTSADYLGNLASDSLGSVCSTTLYSKGSWWWSFCGSP